MTEMKFYKALVVFSGLLPSVRGSNVLVRQSCRALSERGHTIHLCCFARAGHAPSEGSPQIPFTLHTASPVRISPGHRSHPHLGRFVSDLKLAALVYRTACRIRPDIIHAHHYEGFAASLPTARQLRIPIILHAHSLFEDELPTYLRWPPLQHLLRLVGSVMDRELPSRADALITVSEELCNALDPWGDHPVPAYVIPPGIPSDEIESAAAFPHGSEPLVIYAGNTDGYQNLPLLLKAFRIVIREKPNARLRLLCSDLDAAIPALIERLGIDDVVETIVTQNHLTIRRHLHQAWLAVSPRCSDTGFPLKNLDAMALGRPVVASKGSAKAVLHGTTGLVVGDPTPERFAQALLDLLNNPARAAKMGERAREVAMTSYTWENLVPHIENVWKSVCPKPESG